MHRKSTHRLVRPGGPLTARARPFRDREASEIGIRSQTLTWGVKKKATESCSEKQRESLGEGGNKKKAVVDMAASKKILLEKGRGREGSAVRASSRSRLIFFPREGRSGGIVRKQRAGVEDWNCAGD